jgi:hypothetical protein
LTAQPANNPADTRADTFRNSRLLQSRGTGNPWIGNVVILDILSFNDAEKQIIGSDFKS